MWAKRSGRGVLRSVEDGRPSYLKYSDVFMTAPKKPINCVRNSRIRNLNSYRVNGSDFRSVLHDSKRETGFLDRHCSGVSNEQTIRQQSDFANLTRNGDFENEESVYENYEESPQSSQFEKSNFGYPKFGKFTSGNEIRDYIVPQRSQNVSMRRRQLPQLQWYKDENNENNWPDYGDYEPPRKKFKGNLSFPAIWQKFVITFTSLLSLICLTWIAYNWKASNTTNRIGVIKPEKPYFKVLPDVPGGADVPYQDKVVYNRVDPSINFNPQETLMSPTEEPGELPMSNDLNTASMQMQQQMPNYTIIDDRDYYVKCQNVRNETQKQISLIRQRLSTYGNQNVLQNVSCSVRKVANTHGQLGEYILIGPFKDDVTAGNIGRYCQITGEIITVQKKTN